MRFTEHKHVCYDEQSNVFDILAMTTKAVTLVPHRNPAVTCTIPMSMWKDQYWLDVPFVIIKDKKGRPKPPIINDSISYY